MAVLYDAIAVFTLVYFATFIPVVAAGSSIEPGNPLLSAYALAVIYAYFAICWKRGRTLGMQAWRLVLESVAGKQAPQWREINVRFVAALLSLALGGAGYLAALLDPDHRTWHDRWSRTRLVWRVTGRDDSRTSR